MRVLHSGPASVKESSPSPYGPIHWSSPPRPATHCLMHKQISLEEMPRYPLVLFDPDKCEGISRQIERALRAADIEPQVAEHVVTPRLIAYIDRRRLWSGPNHRHAYRRLPSSKMSWHVRWRANPWCLTTYLLHPDIEPSEQLSRFIDRVKPAELTVQSPTP